MTSQPISLTTRDATEADVPVLCQLLNDIIAIGGTTAFEVALTEADFLQSYLTGSDVISCVVAVPKDVPKDVTSDVPSELLSELPSELLSDVPSAPTPSAPVGFQSITVNPRLPEHWGDLATFCQQGLQGTGVGTVLFQHTRMTAINHQLIALNATIRADNSGGLAYYTRQGFVDYAVARGVPLKDGTPVDRLSKRLMLPV